MVLAFRGLLRDRVLRRVFAPEYVDTTQQFTASE